jgi:hypothetical protein
LAIRLFVYHLPSSTRSAWRAALAEAAIEAGWDSISVDEVGTVPFRAGVNTIVQGDNVGVPDGEATDIVILAGSPCDTVDVLMQTYGLDLHGALRDAASRFAHVSDSGIRVISAEASSLEFPGLGEIKRPPAQAIRSTSAGDALAFYETLPPKAGASAAWRPEVFIWAAGGEPGFTDLTGRRRVIQYGPYLMLSAGTWKVDLVFDIAIHRAISELRFEWGILHDCDTISQRVTVAGRYSASLTHTWAEAGAVELRIWLDRSMFDGTLNVVSVTVSKTV